MIGLGVSWRLGDGELGQVVGGADHRPFACDLLTAAQQELTEAPGLLDLAEHRLDGLLAQAVAAAAAPGAPEGGRHGRDPAAGRRGARAHGGGLAVLLPPGRDVGLDAPPIGGLQVRLRAVAGVRRYLPGTPPEVGFDGVDQGFELALVAGRIGQGVGDDDLAFGIDRGLGIIALG